jgi:hypothetical protein
MKNIFKSNRICKVCALLLATLTLPPLAHTEDRDGRDQNKEHRWGDHDTDIDRDRKVPVVPEANAGWVLIPFFGAVLLFSSRRLLGTALAKK